MCSGNNAAATGPGSAVFVDRGEVGVLSADDAAAAGTGTAIVINGWEGDFLSLGGEGGHGESVHLIGEDGCG